MGMLQTSLWAVDGARRFNVSYATVYGLDRHRLEEIGSTGNYHLVGDLQEPHWQRIGMYSPQKEPLQKHQDVITPEYPYRPSEVVSGDLHCVLDDRLEASSWIGSGVLYWVRDCLGWRTSNWKPDFLVMSLDFISPTVMGTVHDVRMWHPRGERYADACVILNRASGSEMFWSGIHSHGRNVMNNTLKIQSYVDNVIQPEVVGEGGAKRPC